jgi:hypothetical protein
MQRIILIIFLAYCSAFLYAQQHSFSEQMVFSDYLIKNRLWDESKTFIRSFDNNSLVNAGQKDSLNYFAGRVYYKSEDFDTAAAFFSKVNTGTVFYNDASFLKSSSLAENHQYEKSKISFAALSPSGKIDSNLLNYELSATYLLTRDISGFDSLLRTLNISDKKITADINKLNEIKSSILASKEKSGLLAGCMSAIIPGLGKVYAGKPKQGLSSFLPVTLLGVEAYEAYRKSGIKSVRFILSAGLFSVFYIGNIWGSVLSVSVVRNEFNEEVNNSILLYMRIPVQRIFGQN